jgi:lipoyl(octanoyl) transferase
VSAPQLQVLDLGLVPYTAALALQRRAAVLRIGGELPEDLLLLVQHPPVVTLGRGFKAPHLLSSRAMLEAQGVELHDVERGGDITVHEPGQLVGYLVLDLKRHRKDLHWFLRQVEQGLIDAVAPFGVSASRRTGLTGVWVQDRKMASIGVHARDWVTWHGFALNVTNDLSTFAHTVPCGIADVEMTTVARESVRGGRDVPLRFSEVVASVGESVAAAFALDVVRAPASVEALLRDPGGA